ncbi:DNA recombination protein RmuC [Pseudoclavibacter sp. CFCC 14310]|uniref:DNA recombination protein RmuC n=1 Tax=Pseudoclavibacter sp. CFCC 14310 TaxID=2615180 RepID=UPI00130191CC|nr:DNA recombination protein RmuC [Pseudoclavibacter sp. CFCC 14310]KAB1645653.1 DNA recombination protein RmuC [Pseudoclavibacter sp. CFCC 14310]
MNVLMLALLGLIAVLCLIVIVLLLRGGRGDASAVDSRALGREVRAAVGELKPDLYAQQHALGQQLVQNSQVVEQRLQAFEHAQSQAAALQREDAARARHEMGAAVDTRLASFSERMQTLNETLATELARLRADNERKLEQMRATVDEKLQGTLERRLGESFRLVSDRLEQVQKGLGEMQTLASDVGGLKRVLTNVKNRGSWGEVQLGRQLEDLLAPDQYKSNVIIRPGSTENVEYAVRLPGRDETSVVYLPIDSKFPQEDYERLLQAQEAADTSGIEAAGRSLEKAVRLQAKTIASKYIDPPHSTDFAIMYLPTEGLFAEVIRRPGLASDLQTQFHVMVTGPTTLMSLLNSLQLGFKTLAIEQRTSEVWKILSAAKTEFGKYGQVWEKLSKQLQTAQRTVDEAGRRTRAVERRLRDVESLDAGAPESAQLMNDLFEADANQD